MMLSLSQYNPLNKEESNMLDHQRMAQIEESALRLRQIMAEKQNYLFNSKEYQEDTEEYYELIAQKLSIEKKINLLAEKLERPIAGGK